MSVAYTLLTAPSFGPSCTDGLKLQSRGQPRTRAKLAREDNALMAGRISAGRRGRRWLGSSVLRQKLGYPIRRPSLPNVALFIGIDQHLFQYCQYFPSKPRCYGF